jgi:hypothetical protein
MVGASMTKPMDGTAFAAAARRVFPDLTAAEVAQLERDWHLVARWVARLPRDLPYEAEPAHCFTPERGRS